MNKLLIHAVLQLTIMVVQLPKVIRAVPNGPYCAAQMALATQSCSVAVPRSHTGNYSITAEDDPEGSSPSIRDDDGREHRHRRGHSHHDEEEHERHHGHHEEERSLYDNCCRWLKELDAVCICDHLSQLPLVLSRLKHSYVIEVKDDCKVTFDCEVAFNKK